MKVLKLALLSLCATSATFGAAQINQNDLQQQVRDTAIAIHEAQMANSLTFLIRGSGFAPVMKPVEMPDNFVAFKLVTDGAGAGGGLMDMFTNPMFMMMSAVGGGTSERDMQGFSVVTALDLSWSSGITVEYGEHRFLVTYKATLDPMDLAGMDKRDNFADLNLKLTLVRVDAIRTVTPRPDMTRQRFVELLMTRLPKQTPKGPKETVETKEPEAPKPPAQAPKPPRRQQ